MSENNKGSICMSCMRPVPDGAECCPSCGYDGTQQNPAGLLPIGARLDRGSYIVGRITRIGKGSVVYAGYAVEYYATCWIREYFPSGNCVREKGETRLNPTASAVETYRSGLAAFAETCRKLSGVPEGTALPRHLGCFTENGTAYSVTDQFEGMTLRELPKAFGARVLVVVVERGGEALIPNGSFVLQSGDVLSLSGANHELRKFFEAIGQYRRPVKNLMIMGGGRIAVYLTRMMEDSGSAVTVVERDEERCEKLCDLIPRAAVVCGDGTSSDVLAEEGLTRADAFAALTGDDGDNIITSMYARRCRVPKIVTKVNRVHYAEILDAAGLDSVVTPKELVAQQLTGYVRALDGSRGSGMETLHRLADGKAEALEFRVGEGSRLAGTPLKDLKLKNNMLIGAVIRGGKSIIPNGLTVLQSGDHAVVVTAAGRLTSLDQILEGGK